MVLEDSARALYPSKIGLDGAGATRMALISWEILAGMAVPKTQKTRGRPRPLHRAAKITPYQFKRVLWSFVQDQTVAEASRQIALSANSIAALYAKLRKFFFDLGVFYDPYRGRDPRQGFEQEGFTEIEYLILKFHLARVSAKRGRLDAPLTGDDHHFAESNWRFDYVALEADRSASSVHQIMYANLLEFIRRFGPVGTKKAFTPEQRRAARALAREQMDKQLLWLERNSLKFKDAAERQELRKLRES
jgi:hypothetical protein